MNDCKGTELKGYLFVFAGGALWGTIGPFIQIMEGFGSTSLLTSFLRMFFSCIILFLFTLKKCGVQSLKINRSSLAVCLLLGLICHGIYNIFYTLAVTLSGVTISAVLLNVAPVFTAILSCILFQEKMTVKKCIILVVNIFGCMLAATGGRPDTAAFSLIGILCGIAAGFCYSMTAIIGRIAGNKSNPFVMSTYSYFFAAVFLAITTKPWSVPAITDGRILITGFLFALIPTAIAYLFYYYGVLAITESSKVPVIASVEMVVAGILGVLFFHDTLLPGNIFGMVMILLSILLMNQENLFRKKKKTVKTEHLH